MRLIKIGNAWIQAQHVTNVKSLGVGTRIHFVTGTYIDVSMDAYDVVAAIDDALDGPDARALLKQGWDEAFDDCSDQVADGMNPANRNPYEA